jgi:hypothetical protein
MAAPILVRAEDGSDYPHGKGGRRKRGTVYLIVDKYCLRCGRQYLSTIK